MTAAFQPTAFQNDAFQIDGAAVEAPVSRGGFWPRDEKVERARERAWRAARRAARELRRSLEEAFTDKPTQALGSVEPAVRRNIEAVEQELAAAEDLGPLAADIRLLRRELMQLLAADRMSRQAIAAAARHAERVLIALLDEEAAMIALLI